MTNHEDNAAGDGEGHGYVDGERLRVLQGGSQRHVDADGVIHEEPTEHPWSELRPPPAQAFGEEDQFLQAPEIGMVAARLIATHEAFAMLRTVPIDYLWANTGGKEGGGPKLGKCSVLRGLNGLYCPYDFVIWLAADHARELMLPPKVLEGVLFHELCHCDYDDKGRPTVRRHDWAGFRSEVEVYGLYLPDMRLMEQSFRQLRMADVA